MDKKVLTQYRHLVEERKELSEKVAKIEQELKKLGSAETTKDTVKGGSGGIQHYVIEGFPSGLYQQKVNILKQRRALLRENESRIAAVTLEVEKFISDIPDTDCIMRRIINLHVIEGKTWNEVATHIGGGNSADGVKQMYSRYVRNN